MVRKVRNGNLDSRTARLRLPLRKAPYRCRLAPRKTLGYYRSGKGSGSWFAMLYDPDAKQPDQRYLLGIADDFTEADGTACLTFEQAQAKAFAWFEQCKHLALVEVGEEVPLGVPYTVKQAVEDYLKDGERRGMKSVSRTRQSAAAHILPSLGALEVAKLTRARIETWHARLAASPKRLRTRTGAESQNQASPPVTEDERRARKDTANRVLTILKAALNHALDRNRVPATHTPWRDARMFRGTTKARVRFLTVQEQRSLVQACVPEFQRLVQAALFTGARYGELVRLQVRDVDLANGTVFVAESKSGKPRHIVLTTEAQAWFGSLVRNKEPQALLFQRDGIERRKRHDHANEWQHGDANRLMRTACLEASLEALTFHELRHTYASGLVNAGIPLAYIAAQLGHADTRMVEKHYGHLAPSAMAQAIRAGAPTLGIGEAHPPLNIVALAGR